MESLLRSTLTQLQQVLSELSDDEYKKPLPVLSHASIGQHTRHIIEFFQALHKGYDSGIVDYDNRERNNALETNHLLATQALEAIMDCMSMKDKDILLVAAYSGNPAEALSVKTTYHREVMYNLEHAIHHTAMIKIGIRQSTDVEVPSDFGVAPSTIAYRKGST
jgi:hypothetical protein